MIPRDSSPQILRQLSPGRKEQEMLIEKNTVITSSKPLGGSKDFFHQGVQQADTSIIINQPNTQGSSAQKVQQRETLVKTTTQKDQISRNSQSEVNSAVTNATINSAKKTKTSLARGATMSGPQHEVDDFQDNSGNGSMMLTRDIKTTFKKGQTTTTKKNSGGNAVAAVSAITRTTSGGTNNYFGAPTTSASKGVNNYTGNSNTLDSTAERALISEQKSAKKTSATTTVKKTELISNAGGNNPGMSKNSVRLGETEINLTNNRRFSGGADFSNSGGATSIGSGSGGHQSTINRKTTTEYTSTTSGSGAGNKGKITRDDESLGLMGSTSKIISRKKTIKIETSGANTSGNDLFTSFDNPQSGLGGAEERFSMDVARGGRSASPNIAGGNARAISKGQSQRDEIASSMLAEDKIYGATNVTKTKKKTTLVTSSNTGISRTNTGRMLD